MSNRIHEITLSSVELGAMLQVISSIENSTTKTLTKNLIQRLTSYLTNMTKVKQLVKLQGATLLSYKKVVTLPEGDAIYTFIIEAELILEMRR